MNLILTAYLNSGKDGQTGKNWDANEDVIITLINSFYKTRTSDDFMVIYTDCFENKALQNGVEWIKIEKRSDITANRYRWEIFLEALQLSIPKNIFCVDVRDVEIFKNPFYQIKNNLITGYEKNSKVSSTWMRQSQQPFITLPDYEQIIEKNKRHTLLNCGIIGGPYIHVLEYLNYICKYQNECNSPNNKSIDMAIHNYTIFKHFIGRFEFGNHVNTDFKANERQFNNKHSLFKHK